MQFSVIDFCCSVPAVPAVCPGGERAGGFGRLAPYADDGDLDYIPDYFVTVDLREDGSADIVYDITWQVIGGDQTDYLSWVKIGLPNAHAEDLTPLTDTISDLQYTGDGGSYAKVVFARRYYSPEVAAQNGGESRVRFAFSVHQNHLFTLNDDGTATFEFTPGWFDDLVVEHMQVRWRSGDGFGGRQQQRGRRLPDLGIWPHGPRPERQHPRDRAGDDGPDL